jgi:hypothetical protein
MMTTTRCLIASHDDIMMMDICRVQESKLKAMALRSNLAFYQPSVLSC